MKPTSKDQSDAELVRDLRSEWSGSVYEGAILDLCDRFDAERTRAERAEAERDENGYRAMGAERRLAEAVELLRELNTAVGFVSELDAERGRWVLNRDFVRKVTGAFLASLGEVS